MFLGQPTRPVYDQDLGGDFFEYRRYGDQWCDLGFARDLCGCFMALFIFLELIFAYRYEHSSSEAYKSDAPATNIIIGPAPVQPEIQHAHSAPMQQPVQYVYGSAQQQPWSTSDVLPSTGDDGASSNVYHVIPGPHSIL
jgi:hypothetical protein